VLARCAAPINRKRRSLSLLYDQPLLRPPNLDGDARYIDGSRTGANPMDLVYIAAGVAIFGLFALYATVLKRI
jgi:hypothetical protein